MNYKPDIYINNPENSCRFALGMSGLKPLFVIGLNPSTADDKKPDQTIKRVLGFAERNNYDSFVMLNLYPKRTPYSNELDISLDMNLHKLNLDQIRSIIVDIEKPSFLAAWGGTITVREYLMRCLKDIIEETSNRSVSWHKIGEMTKSGHPRHPSRAPYSFGLNSFDIEKYLRTEVQS